MIAHIAHRIAVVLRSWPQPTPWRASGGLFCALVMAGLLTSCSIGERPRFNDNLLTPAVVPTRANDGEQAPLQPPDAVAGAAIYAERCVACHGVNGDGNGPQAPTLRAQGKTVANLINPNRARVVKPTEWHQIITNGRIENLMPPFGPSLSAQQRWDVQAYVWSLGTPSQTVSSGAALFAAQCASCHAPTATVPTTATVVFTDLNWLADHSLMDISNGIAAHTAANEPHQAVKLDETQRWQVADFVRTLGYRYADPTSIRDEAITGDGQLLLAASTATTDTAALSEAVVTLRAYDTSGEVFSRTQPLSSKVVSFTNLPRRTDYFYQPEILFEGVKFYGQAQQFVPTTTMVLTNVVPVFNISDNPSQIRVPEWYYFVQGVAEGSLSVVEVYFFSNTGNTAFVERLPNGQTRSLHIALPADARDIRFDPPQIASRYTLSGTDVYYNDVVEPGERTAQVTVIYDLPYNAAYDVSRPVDYAVDNASVLLPAMETMPAGGTPITVTGLMDKGLQNTPNGSFHLFQTGQPIAAGGSLSFRLSGQPRAVPLAGVDSFSIGLGVAALAVVLGGAYLLLTRARAVRRAELRPLDQQREDLLTALATLDRDHVEGKLKDDYYAKRRAELKDALREIWEPPQP